MLRPPEKTRTWLIESLSRDHDRASFDCGEVALNEFLQKLARQQQKKNVGRTFVAVPAPGAATVLGFYTLSAGSVAFDMLPETLGRRLPRYPVPIARLGRLAVDRSMQGQGVGASLLQDALLRVARIALSDLGIHAVIVDAKNENARAFYERYGFISFSDLPLTLFLPTKTILATISPLASRPDGPTLDS
ncbi:MAG: GNAT family N-acetyltransferase [Deltaproteobacteria bacterium]|nr:GNAT family N-acetyltransferase [Deltaproteobacteria bacterium]